QAVFSNPNSAFHLLRPICLQLTEDATTEGLLWLSQTIASLGNVELQELQEYVVFPLRFIIHRLPSMPACRRRTSVFEKSLHCLVQVLVRTRVSNCVFMQELFGELCMVLGPPTEESKVSEDLKVSVVKSLKALLTSALDDSLKSIFDFFFLPSLGHAVVTLLSLAERETARHLRLDALDCLLLLLQTDDRATSTYQSSCLRGTDLFIVGDALASLLPGIVNSLSRIITGDIKQGHKVTVLAVRAWMQVVLLVLDDEFLKNTQEVPPGIFKQDAGLKDPRLADLRVWRSSDWVQKSVMEKLSLRLQSVCTFLEVHQAWQVRLEAATFAGRLLTTSATSLGSVSQGFLLDLLLSTIRDDHPRVCARGRSELAKLFDETNQRFQFEDTLRDQLYKTATHLVHLVPFGTDTEKLMVVGRLQGCLLVLREHVSVALNSLPHLKQLLRSLFLLLAPDPVHGQLLDVSMETDEPNYSTDWPNVDCRVSDWPMPGAPHKQFASFSEVCVYRAIQQVCRLLGYYGDLQLLTCEILEEFHDSEQHRCVIVAFDVIALFLLLLLLGRLKIISISSSHSSFLLPERWFSAPAEASEASQNPSTSCSDQSVSPVLSSPIDDVTGCMEDYRSTVPVSAEDVERFFLQYHRDQAEGGVQGVATPMAGDLGSGIGELSDSGPEGCSKLPLHVCLCKELLERSTHLLAHHNLTIRLQMLEVAGCCVRVLRSHKEDLLPAAHQLWFALVPRLLGDDPRVVLAAFELLGILAQCCGDFLRHRVVSEVLPRLSSSLLNQAMISARAGALYSYTQASRLQYAALKSVGPMCLALGLGMDIEKVAAAALPYLSNRQPEHLQESAIGLFQDLMKLEPDLMWLMLNDLYCPETLKIPHKSLNTPKFAGSAQLQEYAENTLHLLALLDV
uniref:TELO2 interacting protein 1 n=1 Tax=Eptatretus burgeri TaxID=7764 RepID=A0A8C4QHT6_EPTBU